MSDVIELEKSGEQLARVEAQRADQMLSMARSYVIDSPEMAEAAAEDLTSIKAKAKALDEQRKSMTRPLDEAKKRIMALFEGPLSVLKQAEDSIKGSLLTYQRAEQERAEAIRRRQEEAARKLREEEQRRARQAEEAARAAAEEARKAKEAGDAAAAAEAEARAAEAAQAAAAAEQQADLLEHMAPVPVAAPAKLAGVSTREEWDFEVTDANAIPRDFLVVDEKAIRAVVRGLKGKTQIPGVRVFAKPVISARSK